MTRIDFYFNAESRLQIASRITVKAVRQRLRVVIVARDEVIARSLDKLLWSQYPTGFTPHCFGGDRLLVDDTPVLLLVRETDFQTHLDVLINLGEEPPLMFERFQRLVEIVSRDDKSDQVKARKRFRFYKDRGYAMSHYNLDTLNEGTTGGR